MRSFSSRLAQIERWVGWEEDDVLRGEHHIIVSRAVKLFETGKDCDKKAHRARLATRIHDLRAEKEHREGQMVKEVEALLFVFGNEAWLAEMGDENDGFSRTDPAYDAALDER
jgi:hypothetical protein